MARILSKMLFILCMILLPAVHGVAYAAPLSIQIQTDAGAPLSNIPVYAFTEAMAYAQLSATTDGAGLALFDTDDFTEGNYRFRADYLGQQFWTGFVAIPAATAETLTIPHRTTGVTVSSAAGPAAGVSVYLFSESGAYLARNTQTDASGLAQFDLPVGITFKFRTDLFSSQYWSELLEIPASGASEIAISAGGGTYRVTVKKSASEVLTGVPVYLFTESGTYLGRQQTTDANGGVAFSIPDGRYKVRADFLRAQYWSDVAEIAPDAEQDLFIPHQDVSVSVAGAYQGGATPVEGVPVYLFNADGTYLNLNAMTDSQGVAVFTLPTQEYRARADYMHQQYWSDDFSGDAADIAIPMAEAEVAVTWGGRYLQGIPVYVFNTAGTYLGINGQTDAEGRAVFRLAAGDYRFRGDYQGAQYWSEDVALVADASRTATVSTGGGAFTLTLQKSDGASMGGVPCYLFTEAGTYLGLNATTAADGTVTFETATGNFKIRVEYLGYQFWTPVFSLPDSLEMTFDIPHRDCAVQVAGIMSGASENRAAVPVYLFTPEGAYLNLMTTTDANGTATFALPDQPYKVRADYLGMQFWSDNFQFEDSSVSIREGTAEVNVTGAGQNLSGVGVYAFNSAGAYLGLAASTDADGMTSFRLPAGDYRFRADYQSSQYWSEDLALQPDQSNAMAISCGGGDFVLSLSDGSAPMEGVNIYAFNSAGTYLGLSHTTDTTGEVRFALADGSYRFRADYMGYQFWSADFEVPTVFSGGLAIPHQDIQVTVSASYPAATAISNAPVYLFTEAGAYQGQNATTDTGGMVSFRLPDRSYKVRADYLGSQYWSDPFQSQNATVAIPRGELVVHVVNAGSDVAGAQVYAFSEAGSYLNLNATTGSDGQAGFVLPTANYKFRVDLNSEQHWTETAVAADGQSDTVTIDISTINVSIDADPKWIAPGGSTTLTWSSDEAAACSISPDIGDVAPNGVMQVSPAATTEYTITATSGDIFVTDSVTVVVNTAPTITLLEPDGTNDAADASFTITWQDDDPEQNAVIDLYYDTDASGMDGTPIVSDLMEDEGGAAGSYMWDTSALTEGDYYIYAVIDDGVADPTVAYSTGPITISHGAVVPLEEFQLETMEKLMEYQLGRSLALSGEEAIVGAAEINVEPGDYLNTGDPFGSLGFAYLYTRQADQWIPAFKLTNEGVFPSENNPHKQIEFRIDGPSYMATILNKTRTASHESQCLAFPEGEYMQYLTFYKPTGSGPVHITAIDFLMDGEWVSRISTEWWLPGAHMTYEDGAGWRWTGFMDMADYGILRIGGDWAQSFKPEAVRIAYTFDDHRISPQIEMLGYGYPWKYAWDEPESEYLYVPLYNPELDQEVDVRVPLNDHGNGDGWIDLLTNGEPLITTYDEINQDRPFNRAILQDSFGYAVAMDGDIIAVGAPMDSRSMEALGAGAVYVFERDGEQWLKTAKLVASDPEDSSMLGYAVAVSGDTIVAGAPGKTESDVASGAIYVFKKEEGQWRQKAKLVPADGQAKDWFGMAIDTDGTRIIAGVPQADPSFFSFRGDGKAYVYVFNGAYWSLETTLVLDLDPMFSGFGMAVSIDGENIAVGAPGVFMESDVGEINGIVSMFSHVEGEWQLQDHLISPTPAYGDFFGISVALEGDQLIVGADQRYTDLGPPGEPMGARPGAAYVFKNLSGTWKPQETLQPSEGETGDLFGSAVALDDGRYLVGAPNHFHDEDLGNSNGIYLFAPPQTTAYIEVFPRVTMAGEVTLRWRTSNAGTVTISPGVGSVAASGELTVTVAETTTYAITATGPYGTETYQATAFVNAPPEISLLTPDGSDNIADKAFTITWNDQDEDSNASISLYYDTDRCGADGTLIAEGIAEDPEADGDTFVWDTITVPEYEFFVYAVIDDGLNEPVVAYSSGSVSIKHPSGSFIPTIGGGVAHSVALTAEGNLYAWGLNNHGQLGDGTTTDRALPGSVTGLNRVIDVACGSMHNVALRDNGTVWTWGDNARGQLGLGHNLETAVPTMVPTLYGVKTVGAMGTTTVALKNDGTAWAWGGNTYGQLGEGTTEDRSSPVRVLNLNNVKMIAPGGFHTAALRADGTVWTWGSNTYGQLGVSYPSQRSTAGQIYGLSGITAIASGYTHSLALKEDGSVWAWGGNEEGQLGDGTNDSRNYPVQVSAIHDIVQIAAGYEFSVALSANGEVWVWGYNAAGQLGDGSLNSSNTPQQVADLENVIQIQTGWSHCLALKSDGSVWAWGANTYGALGYETTGYYSSLPGETSDESGTGYLTLFDPSVTLPSVVIGASPTAVTEGQSVTLMWSSSGADTVEITPDIGTVALVGALEVSPAATTTYIITATGPGGMTTDSVTVSVIPKPIISFSVSPPIIDPGESVTLSWSVEYADSVAIDDPAIGTVGATGSWLVSPSETAIYTLTATGPAGTSTASLTVYVREYMETVIEYEYDALGRIRRKTFTNQ